MDRKECDQATICAHGERQDRPETSLKQSNQRQKLPHTQVSGPRGQLSSFILFFSLVVLINLCPFQSDITHHNDHQLDLITSPVEVTTTTRATTISWPEGYLNNLSECLKFVQLMFTNPVRLNKRVTRVTLAEAKVLGKMAKVWYIKKKIKKLGKKLKKHTIAVPVFTAIPVYDPVSHMGQVGHVGGMHHAASAYAPVIADQMTVAAALAAAQQQQQLQSQQQSQQPSQQLMTSASNHQQMAVYQRAPGARRRPAPYGAHHAAANRIINAYVPAPPLFVDETGGIYGHYGNAYGRYDGGYHFW